MSHLFVSRRGIVHVAETLSDAAETACGKWNRDMVLIGGVGIGERLCRTCAPHAPAEHREASQDEGGRGA